MKKKKGCSPQNDAHDADLDSSSFFSFFFQESATSSSPEKDDDCSPCQRTKVMNAWLLSKLFLESLYQIHRQILMISILEKRERERNSWEDRESVSVLDSHEMQLRQFFLSCFEIEIWHQAVMDRQSLGLVLISFIDRVIVTESKFSRILIPDEIVTQEKKESNRKKELHREK